MDTTKDVFTTRFIEISNAFTKDCDKLIKEYSNLKTYDFINFCEIWKQMSFSCIYGFHKYTSDLKPFIEICYYVAKKYLIYGENVYMKVGALYLLYGLYYKQPFQNWTKIRITYDEYQSLLNLVDDLRLNKKTEPLYVFAKLKTDNCFNYVVQQKQMIPEFVKYNKPFYQLSNDIFVKDCIREVLDNCQTIFSDEEGILKLKQLNDEYKKKMQEYSAANPSNCLTVFDSTITDDLEKLYKTLTGSAAIKKNS